MNHFSYFSEIETLFVQRRGKQLLLSPKDWALMDEWESRGVPLHIVIRSINDVFDVHDKQPAGTRPIGTLAYCKSEVEAQFVEWQQSQIGKGADAGGTSNGHVERITIESVTVHIDTAIAALRIVNRPEIREAITAAIGRLQKGREFVADSTATPDWEKVDAALGAIERDLEAAMLTSWATDEFERIEKEVDGRVAPYKTEMEEESYNRTRSLMLLKALREASGIPRLGLFYL
jgi:hypothetical protein